MYRQNSSRRSLVLKFGDVMKIIFMVVLLLLQLFPGFGQSTKPETSLSWNNRRLAVGRTLITINGSYRLRGELQDEFHVKNFGTGKTEDFLISRLRLETDVRFSPSARFHLQLQDAHVLGSSFSDQDFAAGNNPFHDPLDINQAYLELQPGKPLQFKIGRQAISFRDRRIFGPGDWGNTGRYAWDAAILTLNNRWLESNWIAGRFILHDPDRWPNKWANGPTAFASYNFIKALPFLLDIFYVFKHDDRGITPGETGAGNLASHSLGFWFNGKWHSWDYGATAVGQMGKWGADDIRAYGLVGSLGYQWQTHWQPLVKLQCIIGSGDSDPTDGIHSTFDGVFGGADTDLYGWMNMFFWQNLREYRLDLKLTPHKALTFKGEYHYFTLDQTRDAWYFPGKAVRWDKTGSSGQELGHELDITVRMKVSKYLELLVGSSFFMPGDFVKDTGKSPQASWYFLETTFYF